MARNNSGGHGSCPLPCPHELTERDRRGPLPGMAGRDLVWVARAYGLLIAVGCGASSSPQDSVEDASPLTRADADAPEASSDLDSTVASPNDSGLEPLDAAVIDAGAVTVGDDAARPLADAGLASDSGAAACANGLGGGPTMSTTTHQDIGVHDPSMIWDGSRYYLFATGGTLGIRSSTNLTAWTNVGNIFSDIPSWVTTDIGTNPGTLWAPDISYFSGQFHVYYAGSTSGSNASVIGLATTPTLQASNANYHWTDQGLVIQSKKSDDFNAIDPNVSFDRNCKPWLAYGSFWSGIKMHKLDETTGKLATDDTTTYSLASRNGGAIEAASIVSHNGYFYLFVSFDTCCQGVNSTYRTMVGRASAITGPYTDKSGAAMMQGAAEQLLATSGRYIGPGGGTAWKDGNTYLYVYHYYDGDANGASKLQIRPIVFGSDDWVTLGDSLFP
jgi:arabinan endo-1,5-alpha-L-arabinosidase